jgi:hypothetical protein
VDEVDLIGVLILLVDKVSLGDEQGH